MNSKKSFSQRLKAGESKSQLMNAMHCLKNNMKKSLYP
jgi:hypothetical protein